MGCSSRLLRASTRDSARRYVAILLTAAMSVLLVFSRSFEALTETFVIAIWPFYGLCVAGIFRLRRLRPDLARPYRVAGYPVVPAVFLVAVVGVPAERAVE